MFGSAPTQTFTAEAVSDQLSISFYLVYAAIAVSLVIWLARTLFRNGEIFLADVFDDDRTARAVNHLLVVGFYLLNLGYALLIYKVSAGATLIAAFNGLVARIGLLLLSLGGIHLFNMIVLWRIRTYGDRKLSTPPPPTFVAPTFPTPPVNFAGANPGPINGPQV